MTPSASRPPSPGQRLGTCLDWFVNIDFFSFLVFFSLSCQSELFLRSQPTNERRKADKETWSLSWHQSFETFTSLNLQLFCLYSQVLVKFRKKLFSCTSKEILPRFFACQKRKKKKIRLPDNFLTQWPDKSQNKDKTLVKNLPF